LGQKIEFVGENRYNDYNSPWYRKYLPKHNSDFAPLGIRKLNYLVRKDLSFMLGSTYYSNIIGKRKRTVDSFISNKLSKSLLYNLSTFSELYKHGVWGKQRGMKHRKVYVQTRKYIKQKSKRGIVKAYHTSSNNNKSVLDMMTDVVYNYLKEEKQKKERVNKRTRHLDLGLLYIKKGTTSSKKTEIDNSRSVSIKKKK